MGLGHGKERGFEVTLQKRSDVTRRGATAEKQSTYGGRGLCSSCKMKGEEGASRSRGTIKGKRWVALQGGTMSEKTGEKDKYDR